MTQPEYVPLGRADRVRAAERLPAAARWLADRPADFPAPPQGDRFGRTGPDQGYGLKLARRFVDRIETSAGEHKADAVAGCLAIGLKRAALFGRAPVIYDFELAFTLFGYLGGAPADLVEYRKHLFEGAAHHYWDQRVIADKVTDATLRLTPADVRSRLANWRDLLAP